jgi:class 3 adenylate cyclase
VFKSFFNFLNTQPDRQSQNIRSLLRRVAETGVTEALSMTDAKYIRFCNIAAFLCFVTALMFAILEVPLIVDWVGMKSSQLLVFALRLSMVVPFLLPLWFNGRGQYRYARIFLMFWAISFCISLTIFYGATAPSHALFLAAGVTATALFPKEERRIMWAAIIGVVIGLVVCLWLRNLHMPLVPVVRPIIQLVVEIVVTIGAFWIIIMVAMVQRFTTDDAERRLLIEQKKSEGLLLNILPEPIAQRLKTEQGSIADGFDNITVMFADLVDFTPLSKQLEPAQLVELMDHVFSEFDQLTELYGLEKVKTIGDAYMVAGGIPVPTQDHTEQMAEMALAMLPVIKSVNAPGGRQLTVRIGIARGAAVAGIIGKKKFSYDLWGDTVNMASRLESHGMPGCIQVNEAVRRKLAGRYEFESRGLIDIKGQGPTETWFLKGRLKDAASA